MRSKRLLSALSMMAVLAGCENEPVKVGSNVEALEIDKVDVLLVVDNSFSMEDLRMELPELLDAFVAGSEEPGKERPELTDIHVAVVSTDMGGLDSAAIENCQGNGDDGLFIGLTSDELEACSSETQAFVQYEDGKGEITTEVAASCIPDVGIDGCSFEQPLEAMLKALWPASNTDIRFFSGEGHGEDANAGFLRDDSLLIVVAVSDEDDCSARDPLLFDPPRAVSAGKGLSTLCATSSEDELHDVDRYVKGLKALRDDEDDPIIFVALSGVPEELASAQSDVDLGDADAVAEYYDEVLDADAMQIRIDDKGTPDEPHDDGIVSSCTRPTGKDDDFANPAYPPRRLVQVAKAFGSAGVIGSICAENFASTIGGVIRATAEKL